MSWRSLPLSRAALVGLLVFRPHGAAHAQKLEFAGPQATRIQQFVLEASPAVASLREELAAARARVEGAGFAPPAVLSGEVEEVPRGYDVSGAVIRLEIGREFLTGGRSAAARALATAEVAVAAARIEAMEQRVSALALRELTRLATANGVARRLAAEDTLLSRAEASLRDRFSVGGARYVDVLRLRAERLRVHAERLEAVAEARAALEGLASLVAPAQRAEMVALADGALATDPQVASGVLPAAPPVDSLLARSVAVRRVQSAVDVARAARDLVLAGQRPRIAGSIGAQRFRSDGGSELGPVLSASVTLPFTARRPLRAEAIAAEREVAAAEAAHQAVRSAVVGALAGAGARYEAARERLAVYDAALLQAASDERESALVAYRTGDFSLVELLDFERALARVEIDRIQARADAVEAYVNLIVAAAGYGAAELE